MSDMDLFTPRELMELYPFLKDHGWSATKIGILFNMGILKGRRKNRKALISLKSFKKFVEFYNSVNKIDIPPTN